jgi:hypothetical protein
MTLLQELEPLRASACAYWQECLTVLTVNGTLSLFIAQPQHGSGRFRRHVQIQQGCAASNAALERLRVDRRSATSPVKKISRYQRCRSSSFERSGAPAGAPSYRHWNPSTLNYGEYRHVTHHHRESKNQEYRIVRYILILQRVEHP